MSSVTREQIIGLLKVAACPESCDNGVVVRDLLHGEIEQCQFCFERLRAIAALQAVEPEAWQSQQAQGEPYGYVYDGQLLCDEQDFADYFDGAQYDISAMTPVYTAPPAPAAVPEGWIVHAKVNMPAAIRGQRVVGYRVDVPDSIPMGLVTDYLPPLQAQPAKAQVPEEAINAVISLVKDAAAAHLNSEFNSCLSKIRKLLTASPAPDHIADVRKMVAPDVSELEKAAQTLWRESYSCESDFIQAVVDAFSKQEEAER